MDARAEDPRSGEDGAGEGATPSIVLDGFSGPLELLLSLARTQQIDLAHLSVADLVDQLATALQQAGPSLGEKGNWLVMACWHPPEPATGSWSTRVTSICSRSGRSSGGPALLIQPGTQAPPAGCLRTRWDSGAGSRSLYFHEVEGGNNGVPACAQDSSGVFAGFNAFAGYNRASGIGSYIGYNLAISY